MDKKRRMKELVILLNKASKAYYQDAQEIMSNYEYDSLYDELEQLEKELGVRLSNSPTGKVGYEVLSELPKEQHPARMLSLDKTKSVETLEDWIGNQEGILSWKMDGLTIVLTYEQGELVKAVTRGNGEIGEVVTNNVRVFKNVPLCIPYKGRLVLSGEAVIKYSDFNEMNEAIADSNAKYKNPRNLCSGSVRQLNNKITAERNVYFFAFALVECEGTTQEQSPDFHNSREEQFEWLEQQEFEVVERKKVVRKNMAETVAWFAEQIQKNDFPSDGLVLLLDDIAYGKSLGSTAKFPRDAIAYKWKDETAQTKLLEVEWSASRTGLINPVAIFEPVELEGTKVSRASLHNISIMEGLELGIGDEITVYKANMIIPQIAENKTRSGLVKIPEQCPVCQKETTVSEENGVKVLFCKNPDCLAKKIKALAHFMSRDAMNVEGLSEATVEKMIGKGFIHELADLFHLDKYREEIVEMEGFGEKSYQNMLDSIEKARSVTLAKFIYSLGIANIGLSTAKLICATFHNQVDQVLAATKEELVAIDGIGEVIADTYVSFMKKTENRQMIEDLLREINISDDRAVGEEREQSMDGLTFVITGSLSEFSNRKAMQEYIEQHGGKVTGSVSSKTNYLINNDNTSSSTKNKKAKELQIPILTEAEFLEMFG